MRNGCLFCEGDRDEPDHHLHCDGRQGAVEASEPTVRLGPPFDGETYEPDLDHERLTTQLARVFLVMRDHAWRTLRELEAATEAPQASISARLRDLRKPRFGHFVVERRRRGDDTAGLFEYRLVTPDEEAQAS